VERSRELESELQKLRANAAVAAAAAAAAAGPVPAPATEKEEAPPRAASSTFGNVMVAATLLLGIILAASIVSTFSDLRRSANASAQPAANAPVPAVNPASVVRDSADRWAPPHANWNCWRNRGTQGPCF
jgi:hypothetical protein